MAPVIETARLRLRQWTDDDVEPWAEMNADPRVMEFFPAAVPHERSREVARLMREDLDLNGYGWFVMERKDAPGFAGVLAVDDIRHEMPFRPLREIGWRLPVDSWGRGYATEAASALLGFAFERLRWPEIIAMTAVINVRSQRLFRPPARPGRASPQADRALSQIRAVGRAPLGELGILGNLRMT